MKRNINEIKIISYSLQHLYKVILSDDPERCRSGLKSEGKCFAEKVKARIILNLLLSYYIMNYN